MWYFRGFDVARQITDTKEVDKDNEYETKLRNLISENKAGRKEYTELRNVLSILFTFFLDIYFLDNNLM